MNFFEEDDSITALEHLKPLDDGAKNREVFAAVSTLRAAVLDMAKSRGGMPTDVITRSEFERMGAELTKKVEAARAVGVEYTPPGTDSDLLARYVKPDGSVDLGYAERQEPTLNLRGELVKRTVRTRGILVEDYPVSRRHKELVDAYQAFTLVRRLASRNPAWEGLVARQGAEFIRIATSMPGAIGAYFRSILADSEAWTRALNGASTSGSELFSTPTVGNLIRPYDMMRSLAGRVQHREVEAQSFYTPVVSGRVLPRKRGATGDNTAKLPKSTITTSNATVTVQNLSGQVKLDSDLPRRSGNAYDILELVRSLVANGFADVLEIMLLHGDTAGTHQDTLATWTLGSYYTAGLLAGADSPLTLALGMRAHAGDKSAITAGGGTFDAADHFGAAALMGSRFANAEMVVGVAGFLAQIVANSLFTTADKAGDRATLQSPTYLGRIGPVPIHLSQFLAAEYASSGLYTGSGATNTFVYFDGSAWVVYRDSAADVEWDVTVPQDGEQYIGATQNLAIALDAPSTDTVAVAIANL